MSGSSWGAEGQPEERNPARPALEPNEVSLQDLILTVWRHRRLVVCITGIGVALGLLTALLSPKMYRAQTRIVPAVYLAGSSELSPYSQWRSVAAQWGFDLGSAQGNPSPLFPQILSSRDLIVRLLRKEYALEEGRSIDLLTYMKIQRDSTGRGLEQGVHFLRAALGTAYDMKSGVSTISATFRDPRLAAAVVNACAEEMDRFIQDLKASQAGERVQFISRRLTEVQQQLADAENSLKLFRERNRQILGAPQLMLEETRLNREVTVNEQVFLTLKTQYEVARIDEVRNLPDIMVIEKAVPPTGKDSPKRRRIVVTWTLGFGIASLAAAFAIEYTRGIRAKLGLGGGRR